MIVLSATFKVSTHVTCMKTILFTLFVFALGHPTAGVKLIIPPESYLNGNVTLQAKIGKGLRASIHDFCGMEELNFLYKRNHSDQWIGDQVKAKTGGSWIYEDPYIKLAPGDRIYYSCGVMYKGAYFTKGNAEWEVQELINEYAPIEPPLNPEDCSGDVTTLKPDSATQLPETTLIAREPPAPNAPDTSERPPELKLPETESPAKHESKNISESEMPKKPSQKPSNMPILECEPLGPQLGGSYQQKLERRLAKLQCDNMRLAEQSFLDKQALRVEIKEIVQLHDALGKRIKNLEMLLRS